MEFRPVSSMKISIIPLMIAVILSVNGSMLGQIAEGQEVTRLSELVKFDLTGTDIYSNGVDGWDFFVVGRVNSTTTILSRLVNTGDTPLQDVEVTCTVYWYDGFYPDRGEVMFKDLILIDVPPGDGSLSETFEFYWVPTFAGAYMLNISAHIPGDAREMSTEPIFFQGLRYDPLPGQHFYTGVWIATEYWDGSSMEGWESYTQNGPVDQNWRSVDHPMSLTGSNYHSPPSCFWAGNTTTWKVNGTGNLSLVTPVLDLSRFDPEPYDLERGVRRPQVFFLYRYRGELTENLTTVTGILTHYISTDNGTTWSPLLDFKGEYNNLTGKTPGSTWSYSTRPAWRGEEDMVGVDLGPYQGEEVRIRMDLVLSGKEEVGFLIDDVTLMGMDLVESQPFTVSHDDPSPSVDPGSSIQFDLKILPRRTIDPFDVRLQCVGSSGMIDVDEDIMIEPQIISFPEESTVPVDVSVTLTIPENERSGEGRITIRAAGGGISEDIELVFRINPRHNIISWIIYEDDPEGLCTGSGEVDLHIRNGGNIIEDVHFSFVSDEDIDWSGGRDTIQIEPGEESVISGVISHKVDATSGLKDGFFIVSLSQLPANDEIFRMIQGNEQSGDWDIHPINCSVEQFRSVEIVALVDYREIEDPPENGTLTQRYEIFLMNNGNGHDRIDFAITGLGSSAGMDASFPSNLSLDPGSSRLIEVAIDLTFPVPFGRYIFNLSATNIDGEIVGTVELILVIGSRPISSGTFFTNSSIVFEPKDVIKGMETIISFRTQTFGFPIDDRFTVGLIVDDLEVSSFDLSHSLGKDEDYQITWKFQQSGLHNVTLRIYDGSGSDDPDLGLHKEINMTLQVMYIDLYSSEIRMDDVDTTMGQIEVDPGTYDIEAIIWNIGDIDANIVVVTLEVMEVDSVSNLSVQSVNLTEIGIGQENMVQFKPVKLEAERNYRLTITIDNKGRWSEDRENDEISLSISVGELPPEEPIWRESWFQLVTLGFAFFITAVLFLYLMRKKL